MTEAEKAESKRGRVRRLLIDPLTEEGFRFPHRSDPEANKKFLNRLADGMAYLSDRGLAVLRASLRTKGEGSSRCFWPSYITIDALAEHIEHRPLEQIPGLLSWFTSKAGAEAIAADRLVSEFKFWTDNKRPPMSDHEKRFVADRASQWNQRARSTRDRINRGMQPLYDYGDWLEGYDARRTYIEGLIAQHKAGAT
jgi:hypothetical protein